MKRMIMTHSNVSANVKPIVETMPAKAVNAIQVSKTGRLIISFVEILIIILLAYMAVNAFYSYIAPRPDFAAAYQANIQIVSSGRDRATYDTIVAFDPFYRKSDAAAVQTKAPESSLKITIAGLRVSEGGAGAAIIDVQGDGQKLINLGEEITSGVTLSRIFTDRVEINRRGIRETVYMTKRSGLLHGQASNEASETPTAASNGSDVDFSDILTRIRLVPVRDEANRRISGFRVAEETPLSLLSGAGLAVGDIIKSVNESRLSSFERLQELGEDLQTATVITIEIERRGQKMTLTL